MEHWLKTGWLIEETERIQSQFGLFWSFLFPWEFIFRYCHGFLSFSLLLHWFYITAFRDYQTLMSGLFYKHILPGEDIKSIRSVFHCFYWGKTFITHFYAKFGAILNFINLKTEALVCILRISTVQNALKKNFFFFWKLEFLKVLFPWLCGVVPCLMLTGEWPLLVVSTWMSQRSLNSDSKNIFKRVVTLKLDLKCKFYF